MPDQESPSIPLRETREVIQEAPVTNLVLEKKFVGVIGRGDTTPSVKNVEHYKATNTAPTNITYFDDGQDAQHVIIRGDGFTTVVHDVTKICTNTGTNLLLAINHAYEFIRYDGVWIEHT